MTGSHLEVAESVKGHVVNDIHADSPFNSLESLTVTAKVGTIDNVVQDFWMGIKDWIHKPNWSLANCRSFLIQLHGPWVS